MTDHHEAHHHEAGADDRHAGHSPEMFRDRLAVSTALAIPILYFSERIQEWFGFDAVEFPGDALVTPVLATVLFVYGGRVFIIGAFREMRRRAPAMMTLITLAISVAYGYSLAVSLGIDGEPFYWELATLIVVMLLGHWVEMRSIQRAGSALDRLAELIPSTVHRIEGDDLVEVSIDDVGVDDRLLIRPGEQVPADGIIEEGSSSIDESFLTGESLPVPRSEGDEVVAGAVNGDGALTVRVTATGDESTLSQMMRLVQEAQASRTRFQGLADRAAFWLVIVAIAASIPTFAVWLAFGDEGATFAVARGVTVLVIACPHALGLAIPLVMANATAMSAGRGILVRDRDAFERANRISLVALDKTGTLTEGEFEVVSVTAGDGIDEAKALRLAASLERSSEHPLAAAIVGAAEQRGLSLPTATDVRAEAGMGISGSVDGGSWRVGRPEWAVDLEMRSVAEIDAALEAAAADGRGAVVLMDREAVRAVITLADRIRPTARKAMDDLRDLGVTPVMITGDAEAVARTVASELGIERFHARVLPGEKAEIVDERKTEGRVAFVGDGINDAPALVGADLGIAIGAGTNVAIESADVVLVESDPAAIARTLRLSALTRRKMLQNLAWATGYNVVAIPLAAGVAAGAGLVLSPAIGALLMSASTVIVAINAVLLRRARI
ncbi:MAG TPA: heavy metal translocating P-type ATPase [Acidimicrobiia bacterium]|nr:heavy metal translocating P-type ATPase [Acidimicrobiia bacterium]